MDNAEDMTNLFIKVINEYSKAAGIPKDDAIRLILPDCLRAIEKRKPVMTLPAFLKMWFVRRITKRSNPL